MLGTGCEEMRVLVPVPSRASPGTCPASEPPFPSSLQILIPLAALKVYDSKNNVCNHDFLSIGGTLSDSTAGLSPK